MVLVERRIEGSLTHPILVVAKPTVEHPGTKLLRFNAIPTACKRTKEDLEPFWIPVPSPQSDPTSPQIDITASAPLMVEGTIGCVREEKSRKERLSGIEKFPETKDYTATDTHLRICASLTRVSWRDDCQMDNTSPCMGTHSGSHTPYSFLGTYAGDSRQCYTGQQFGLSIRLENLYIARECVMSIDLITQVGINVNVQQVFEELDSPVKNALGSCCGPKTPSHETINDFNKRYL
jgi:hypothetical protein